MNQQREVDAALLYVRVSSKRQEDDGDGTGSQEHLCRRHAAKLGVPVEKVFYDSRSGFHDFVTRPGIVGALKHIKANRSKRYIVIFDDLKRLSRRTRFYWELRDTFDENGAVVASPNFKFDNTPHGRHHETITVSHGELEREENRLQVIQKMTARVERGYFVTRAPIGYRYIKVKGEGARLVPDETFAPIVRDALEGFASRRFESQAEVQRFLEDHPEWPRDKSGKRAGQVNMNRIKEMLLRPIYAGIISAPHWGVEPRKGLHEPLIAIETHQKILARLNGEKRAPARRDLNQDFPLRGFVQCTCCEPLTAGWSKGRNTEYPYYLCYNRGCELYGKSIRRDRIEGEFEVLLKALVPSENLFRIAVGMFKRGWERRWAESAERTAALRSKLADTERQIGLLLDRIVDAKSQTVFEAMEQRIDLLSVEKLALAEKIAHSGSPPRSFDDSLRTALTFLANPWKLWASGRLAHQRAVLKLAFSSNLQYDRNSGFRTAEMAAPFKALADSHSVKKWMVDTGGLEPHISGEDPGQRSEKPLQTEVWMIEQRCVDKGLRMTDQRRVIARVLSEAADHPDAEELHRRAAAIDANISLATVYRTVKLFEDSGIIERHDFRDGRSRYEESPDEHHDHLIDAKSGRVVEFQSDEIEKLQVEIARKLGYRLVDHRLELYGVPLEDEKK